VRSEMSAYKIQTPGDRGPKMLHMYSLLWVISQRLNFIFLSFGTPCLFRLHRRCKQFRNTLFHHHRRCMLTPSIMMEQCVPKRRHIKFRRRRITQNKKIHYSEHVESLKIKNVAHVIVYLGGIITCRFRKITPSAQAQVTLQLTISLYELVQIKYGVLLSQNTTILCCYL